MTQYKIITILKQHKGQWFTSKQICGLINQKSSKPIYKLVKYNLIKKKGDYLEWIIDRGDIMVRKV